MKRTRRTGIVGACAASLLPLAAVPAGAAATPAAGDASPARTAAQRTWDQARCGAPSSTPVRNGVPMKVKLPSGPAFTVGHITTQQWRRPGSADPTWQMQFYSLEWVKPLAKRAYDDGQKIALSQLISQVESFYRVNPDRGTSALGWDEGTSLRRLHTLSCLHALTGDARPKNRMPAEIGVLFGPRYYGPPRHPVHNHGLMANVNIVIAGEMADRPDWVARANARMRAESTLAFTRAGTSKEQSAAYHLVNTTMWRNAAERMAAVDPRDATARQILAKTAQAQSVSRWLTEPDGRLVQIGDTARVPGVAPKRGQAAGTFRDDEAGLLVGRWSWTDPATTYYTVRYGPARFAHGHPDKGAVTWTTSGARVLVGPGYYSYDWKNPYASYARRPEAHNVAWPMVGRYDQRATASLRPAGSTRTSRSWTVTDRAHRVAHTRTVRVDGPGRTLSVADTYARGAALRQSWHLAPEWKLVGTRARTATFRNPDGRTLRMTTTGSVVSTSRGRTRPVAGWNYPTTGSRVPAWEIIVGGSRTTTTTFTVR